MEIIAHKIRTHDKGDGMTHVPHETVKSHAEDISCPKTKRETAALLNIFNSFPRLIYSGSQFFFLSRGNQR